jgi:hypothetical protein
MSEKKDALPEEKKTRWLGVTGSSSGRIEVQIESAV